MNPKRNWGRRQWGASECGTPGPLVEQRVGRRHTTNHLEKVCGASRKEFRNMGFVLFWKIGKYADDAPKPLPL